MGRIKLLKDRKELDIIVCDDSKLARQILVNELEKNGIGNVKSVGSGDELINVYKEQRADLVFLDLVMPDKSGRETLEELRNYDNKAQVIIVSSVGTSDNLKEVLKNGAIDFIQKPIDGENLKSVLNKLIK